MMIKKYIPKRVIQLLHPFYKSIQFCVYNVNAKVNPTRFQYYCSCCNVQLENFVDGKYKERTSIYNPVHYQNTVQEVQCPICGSIPRHRILASWMGDNRIIFNGNILYFSCERGIKQWLKKNKIKVTTADLFRPADLKLDLCNIDQPDNSWDWIICNHVLEHVDVYKRALHELYRILKPGGMLIISFPILSSLTTVIEEDDAPDSETEEERRARRLKNYGQSDHLRIFGADSKDILIQTGFKVDIIDGSKMDKRILPVVGPADYDVNYLFLCKKPQDDN